MSPAAAKPITWPSSSRAPTRTSWACATTFSARPTRPTSWCTRTTPSRCSTSSRATPWITCSAASTTIPTCSSRDPRPSADPRPRAMPRRPCGPCSRKSESCTPTWKPSSASQNLRTASPAHCGLLLPQPDDVVHVHRRSPQGPDPGHALAAVMLRVQADLQQRIRYRNQARRFREPGHAHDAAQGRLVQAAAQGLKHQVIGFAARLQCRQPGQSVLGKHHCLALEHLEKALLGGHQMLRPGAQILIIKSAGGLPGPEVPRVRPGLVAEEILQRADHGPSGYGGDSSAKRMETVTGCQLL